MELLLVFLVFVTGFGMPVQLAINAQLDAHWAGNPVLTAFVSFGVGTLALLFYLLAMRVSVPAFTGGTSWWYWCGGLFGACFVALMALVIPRIGAATALSVVLAGQMCMSLILDHYGLLGLAERSLSWQRFLGALLVVGGAVLIRRF